VIAYLAAAAGLALVAGLAARPFGLPWALFPRRWRCWYRSWRKDPPWPMRPRSRMQQRSSRVPKRLYAQVMAADRARCVACGERWRELLHVDHIVPWALGGLSCLFNLMVLCEGCNLTKSSYFRTREGRVFYRSWRGYRDQPRAAAIVRRERWRRKSPLRWLRAYL